MDAAYACGSGGVMFVPEEIGKTKAKIIVDLANANDDDQEENQEE